MVLMENGRMDSKRDIATDPDRFIVISGKGIDPCFSSDSTTAPQDVDKSNSVCAGKTASISESNCAKCRGTTTIADRTEFACIKNGGEGLSFDHETRTHNTLKTNSSQCNSNSQNSCCRNVENALLCLSIANHESVKTLESNSSQNLEFLNVISPEITTNLRTTEETNGAPNENNVIQSVPLTDTVGANFSDDTSEISYISYESENQMPDIMKLIQKDLSEPYSIYTYRYFIHNWPHLCFLAVSKGKSVGAIVCKLDLHRKIIKRGYIAMLAVDEGFRKKGIGSNLVLKAIRVMATEGADEVVLETEITNQPALRLYENLGFVRDKRLFRYYLNGVDALRLKLWLR